MTPAGAVLDPVAVLISLGANSQGFPHAASDGTNTLVTWFDHRRGGGGLYGGRVGPDGQVLDGQGFLITDAGGFGGATAFDGTDFLVAWTGPDPSDRSRNTIQLARVSRAGVVLDRFPVATAADGETISEPTLAFGGATLLVAYYRRDAGRPFNAQLEATLIGPDPASGVVVAEGFLGFDFDVVHGPGGFLFAVTADRPAVSIFGTLVTTSGTIVTPSWFPIAPVGQGLPSQPQVAANGEHYLVAWTAVTDPSDEIGGSTIRGARVDGSGTVLDPTGIPIAAGPGRKDEPSVAANGPFLVTWRDRRRDPSGDLYATRVDPDGAVARPDGFEIGSSTLSRPALAPGVGVGTFTFAYSRYVPEQPYGANRVFTRTVNPK